MPPSTATENARITSPVTIAPKMASTVSRKESPSGQADSLWPCSTWNTVSLSLLHPRAEPGEQLVELVEIAIVQDELAFAFFAPGSNLHPKSKLAAERLFELLEVRR